MLQERSLEPLELLAYQDAEQIAETVACTFSPAQSDYTRGALMAAETIRARIAARYLGVPVRDPQ